MIRCLTAFVLLAFALSSMLSRAEPATLKPVILSQKPHDRETFTQGLIVNDNQITETSGLHGKSFVVRYDAESNRVLQKMTLPLAYFAEGITQVGNKLYMLTWKAGKLFVLRSYSFEFVNTMNYDGEGWGITYDGNRFITSDGSARLAFRDFNTFKVNGTLGVHEGAKSWDQLNELEFAHGLIWANVWQSPYILAIDPATGEVVGKADLSELVAQNSHDPGKSVLNGIAYDSKANAFWITGKLWPTRYLVHFVWHKAPVESANTVRAALDEKSATPEHRKTTPDLETEAPNPGITTPKVNLPNKKASTTTSDSANTFPIPTETAKNQ